MFCANLFTITAIMAGIVRAAPKAEKAIDNEVSAPVGLSNKEERVWDNSTETKYGWTQTYSSSSSYITTPPSSGSQSWSMSSGMSVTSSIFSSSYMSMYGSGSSNGGSGFNSCVQQCQAQFGLTSAFSSSLATSTSISTTTSTTTSSSSSVGGATHIVVVAPTQGVLRFVPFAVNASIGDTVRFTWGANNHTVTKSSGLTPCNKTLDAPFTSGVQLKGFVFDHIVNDTNTTFFYCGVPTHCEKGMFGIINPPNALGASAVGSMTTSMAANNSAFNAMLNYASNATAGNTVASHWGQSIDLASIPSWAQQSVAEGVLYTQTFIAANPNTINQDGTLDFGLGGATPVVPQDITVAADGGSSSMSSSSSVMSATSSAVTSSGTSASAVSNGATSTVSLSSTIVAFVALGMGILIS